MIKWLQGKKTYISAAVLLLTAVVGWWFGAINGTEATGMIAGAFGLAGLGARSARYAQMTFAALEDVKQAARSGQKLDAVAEIRAAIAKNGRTTGGNAPK